MHHLGHDGDIPWRLNDLEIVVVEGIRYQQTIRRETPLHLIAVLRDVGQQRFSHLGYRIPALLPFRRVGNLAVWWVDDERRTSARRNPSFAGLQPDLVEFSAGRYERGERREQTIERRLLEFSRLVFGQRVLSGERLRPLEWSRCLVAPDTLQIGISPWGSVRRAGERRRAQQDGGEEQSETVHAILAWLSQTFRRKGETRASEKHA